MVKLKGIKAYLFLTKPKSGKFCIIYLMKIKWDQYFDERIEEKHE